MYQVLYRKWRPQTFADVVGQDDISYTLKNEIASGHIAHAYLFTGSRGTGKTSCAKIFALAVNCKNNAGGNPCGRCEICKEAAKGDLLDISEIDAASNNGVENIRIIKEETFLVPALCKYRVYIIDEAHMLSTQAFNAFLKILEEPPKHVIFILATTEPHKIPATILSRCQRFEFHRISDEAMSKRIKYICQDEGVEIEDGAINIIIHSADGAMRDALSLLDRCVSCGKTNLTVRQVESILGIADKESIKLIFECLQNKNALKAIEIVDDLYKRSKSMLGVCEGLMELFRREMIYEISKKSIGEKFKCFLNSLDYLTEVHQRIFNGSNARMEMEIALTKLCYGLTKNEVNDKHVEYITESDTLEKVNKSTAEPNKIGNKEAEKEQNIEKDSVNISNELKEVTQWPEVIKLIEKSSKSKSMSLAFKGSRAYESGDFILIDAEKSLAFELLREQSNREEMRSAIKSVTGKMYKLGPLKKKQEKVKKADPLEEFIEEANNQGVKIEYE